MNKLLEKIKAQGVPLVEYAGVKPYRGVVTGCNDAFVVDTATKESLVEQDGTAADVIRPYLRGQDITRWHSGWDGQWMIFARRGIDINAYPSIKKHLERFRSALEPKPKNWSGGDWPGRKPGPYQWYEIQDSIGYWREFDKPKISYQVIQFHPSYALDREGFLGNDKTFFLPIDDAYLLAVLNSPLMWWHNWRTLTHLKDEALSPLGYMMEQLPIAQPTDQIQGEAEIAVGRLVEIAHTQQTTRRQLLDWLRVEHDVAKPTLKLKALLDLDSDAFVVEVRKARGRKRPLTSAALANLRDEYARSIAPMRPLATEALRLEHHLSDLVNAVYHLTPDEIALLWQTAPPRMPLDGPSVDE